MEDAINRVSVKIYELTRDELEEEKRKYKKRPKPERPDYADLVLAAWNFWKAAHSNDALTVLPDTDKNPRLINGFTPGKKSDNVTSTDEEGRHTKAQGDLNEILASGDVGAMDAITKNLDAFVRLVRLEKGKHRPGSDRKGKESGGPGGQHQKPKRSAG